MPRKFATLALAMGALSTGGSACAMKSSPPQAPDSVSCRVVGGEKLPPESGGAAALCAAIEQAAAGTGAAVEVSVQSRSELAATVKTASGETLPVQKFAISDSSLTSGSFERFARAIAMQLGRQDQR